MKNETEKQTKIYANKQMYIGAADPFIYRQHDNKLIKTKPERNFANCHTKNGLIDIEINHKNGVDLCVYFQVSSSLTVKFCKYCLMIAATFVKTDGFTQTRDCLYCNQNKQTFLMSTEDRSYTFCSECIGNGAELINPMVSITEALNTSYHRIGKLETQMACLKMREE
jgi:hypothetical protein